MVDLAKVKTLATCPAKDALNVFDAAKQGLPVLPGYATPEVPTAGPSQAPVTSGRTDVATSSGPLMLKKGTVMRMRKAASSIVMGTLAQEGEEHSWALSELLVAPPV